MNPCLRGRSPALISRPAIHPVVLESILELLTAPVPSFGQPPKPIVMPRVTFRNRVSTCLSRIFFAIKEF